MSISVAATDPAVIPDGFTWENSEDWCPESLKPYFRRHLIPGTPEFNDVVDRVYSIWAANDFMPVEIAPEPGDPIPSCARGNVDATFDVDFPDEDEYEGGEDDPQYEWDLFREQVEIAKSQKVCAGCPLADQCLASSVTMPAITLRNSDTAHNAEVATYNTDWVMVNGYGIHGGYGPGARASINKAIVKRQRAEHEG